MVWRLTLGIMNVLNMQRNEKNRKRGEEVAVERIQ